MDPKRAPQYRQEGQFVLLSAVYDAGLRDPDLEAGLAQLCFDAKVRDPRALADAALAYPEIAGDKRCIALWTRAPIDGLNTELCRGPPGLGGTDQTAASGRRLATPRELHERTGEPGAAAIDGGGDGRAYQPPAVGGAAVFGGLLSRARRRPAGRVAPTACRTLSRAGPLAEIGLLRRSTLCLFPDSGQLLTGDAAIPLFLMLVYNAKMTPPLSPTPAGTRRGTVRRWLLAGLGLLKYCGRLVVLPFAAAKVHRTPARTGVIPHNSALRQPLFEHQTRCFLRRLHVLPRLS